VSPELVPKGRRPWPGLPSNGKCPNQLARRPCAKQWAPQWLREVCLAWCLRLPGPEREREREREREQAAPRRVTLTESEGRSRSGGQQWKREANDGWESRQGSKVRNPQSGGTWGQFSSLGSGEGGT
jgi:hypothetical protein